MEKKKSEILLKQPNYGQNNFKKLRFSQYTVIANNFIWLCLSLYDRIMSPEQAVNLEGDSK